MVSHRGTEAVDKTFQHCPSHFVSPPPLMAFYIKCHSVYNKPIFLAPLRISDSWYNKNGDEKLLWSTGTYLPTCMVSYPRRDEISSTPLREPKIVRSGYV